MDASHQSAVKSLRHDSDNLNVWQKGKLGDRVAAQLPALAVSRAREIRIKAQWGGPLYADRSFHLLCLVGVWCLDLFAGAGYRVGFD